MDSENEAADAPRVEVTTATSQRRDYQTGVRRRDRRLHLRGQGTTFTEFWQGMR